MFSKIYKRKTKRNNKSKKSKKNKKTKKQYYKKYKKNISYTLNISNTLKTTKISMGGQNIEFAKQQPLSFTVEYPGIGIITQNQDLTEKNDIYNIQPLVILYNANIKRLYLLVMYDPDAPNGVEKKTGNYIYTHWVALLDAKNPGQIKTTLVNYEPPSPPRGTHKYKFCLYDIKNMGFTKLEQINNMFRLENNENNENHENNITRQNYFINKIQNLKQYKIKYQIYFIVKAKTEIIA